MRDVRRVTRSGSWSRRDPLREPVAADCGAVVTGIQGGLGQTEAEPPEVEEEEEEGRPIPEGVD